MYNDEKKLITDIKREKDVDENLGKFADAVLKADFEYACQKFTLNYVVIRELLADKDIADDPYIYECILGINKLVGTYLAEDKEAVTKEDFSLISGIRNKIISKMKALTSYTDAFELYEYILNRKEFCFPENIDDEIREELESFDAGSFGDEIFNFIFSDEDKVTINAKIQQVVGQIPLRMTKKKFYDIIGEALSLYNGSEAFAVDDFARTIEETALISLPENFDTEYSDLKEALDIISEGDFVHLDYEEYTRLSDVLDNSAGFINSVVSDYMMLIELVNDLYSMMLSISAKPYVSDKCLAALSIIRDIFDSMDDDNFPVVAYDRLVANEGAQEEAGEHRMIFESAIFDIEASNYDDIIKNGLENTYKDIDTIDKLLSGSMFVDIDNVMMQTEATADAEYIAAVRDRLVDEFSEKFEKNSQTVNRAIMAKILSSIPVFFNSKQEIKDYIDNSLAHCSNISEAFACYMVISDMMEG